MGPPRDETAHREHRRGDRHHLRKPRTDGTVRPGWWRCTKASSPTQQMTRALGLDHSWDAVARCFRPAVDAWGNSAIPGILVAGDSAGIGGARAAEHAGRIAAAERCAGWAGSTRRRATASPPSTARARRPSRGPPVPRPALRAPARMLRPADEVTVCRCEEMRAGAVRDVVAQGCHGPNQAKSFLRAAWAPARAACAGRP